MDTQIRNKKPPQLDIRFFHNIGMLILINCIPLGIGIYIIVQLLNHNFVILNKNLFFSFLYVIVLGLISVLFFFLALPTTNWLWKYCWWHIANRNSLIWIPPLIISITLWIITLALTLVIAILMLVMLIYTIQHAIPLFYARYFS